MFLATPALQWSSIRELVIVCQIPSGSVWYPVTLLPGVLTQISAASNGLGAVFATVRSSKVLRLFVVTEFPRPLPHKARQALRSLVAVFGVTMKGAQTSSDKRPVETGGAPSLLRKLLPKSLG